MGDGWVEDSIKNPCMINRGPLGKLPLVEPTLFSDAYMQLIEVYADPVLLSITLAVVMFISFPYCQNGNNRYRHDKREKQYF